MPISTHSPLPQLSPIAAHTASPSPPLGVPGRCSAAASFSGSDVDGALFPVAPSAVATGTVKTDDGAVGIHSHWYAAQLEPQHQHDLRDAERVRSRRDLGDTHSRFQQRGTRGAAPGPRAVNGDRVRGVAGVGGEDADAVGSGVACGC